MGRSIDHTYLDIEGLDGPTGRQLDGPFLVVSVLPGRGQGPLNIELDTSILDD